MASLSNLIHTVGHLIWVGAQFANAYSSVVPVKYRPIVAAAIGLIQAVHGYYIGRFHAQAQ